MREPRTRLRLVHVCVAGTFAWRARGKGGVGRPSVGAKNQGPRIRLSERVRRRQAHRQAPPAHPARIAIDWDWLVAAC